MTRPVPLGDLAAIMRYASRALAREGHWLAVPIAQVARVMVTGAPDEGCKSCGGPVEVVPRGRPRLHCHACRAPRQSAPKVHADRDGRDTDAG